MAARLRKNEPKKLKLEPVAALMMLWAKKAFCSKALVNYINHLDLSSGEDLYKECLDISDWYEEIVLNRKFFVEKIIKENLEEQESVLIFLAAGKSPLALEILIDRYDKINRILEVDLDGMEKKQELYDQFYQNYSPKIKCITADIRSPVILSTLNELLKEYYKNTPCVIVLDGAICYLTPKDFNNIISSFKSISKHNTFIIEYLLPFDSLSVKTKEIPSRVFEVIKKNCHLEKIRSLSHDKIADVFSKNGGRFLKSGSLPSLERERIGKNRYFNNVNESWIECAAYLI